MTSTLMLSVACDRRLLPTDVPCGRLLEWVVAAPEVGDDADRTPLNLALVLDRSSSMQGSKLSLAQEAACQILARLAPCDRVAVISYDDTVHLLTASAPATPEWCAEIQSRIRALVQGGCSDMAAGWFEGSRQVLAHADPASLNRVLLLTDGQANRGVTDREALLLRMRQLRKLGVSTSVIGLGLDQRAALLSGLAAEAGGHYHTLEHPARIPAVLQAELDALFHVAAREVVLEVRRPDHVALELLGGLAGELVGDRLRIYLNHLCAGDRRHCYLRMLATPAPVGTRLALEGRLIYATRDGREGDPVQAEQTFRYASAAEVALEGACSDLLRRAGQAELAALTLDAVQLERLGHRHLALQRLRAKLAQVAPHLDGVARAAYLELLNTLTVGGAEDACGCAEQG